LSFLRSRGSRPRSVY